MKRLSTFLLALMLITLGASAQSTDVTATYIQNPSFETPTVSELAGEEDADKRGSYAVTNDQLTGWTLVAPTGTGTYNACDLMTLSSTALDDDFAVPTVTADGYQWLYLRDAWHADGAASVMQEVTLPAGNYKVSVDNMCLTKGTGHSVKLVAGELASATLPTYTATPEAWNTTSVKFTLDEETTLEVGVVVTFANSNGLAVLLDNFKLYEVNELELTAHEEEFAIEEGVGGQGNNGQYNNDTPTAATTESFSHWSNSNSTGGSFQLNTWSAYYGTTEPAEPWVEYWVGSGSYLGASTISHETLVGLPAGNYEVSIYANANNESQAAITNSPTLNANGKSLSIVEAAENNNSTYNYYGTYTLECEVGSDGLLDISFDIPANALNWFLFKDLSVVMIADDYPTIEPLDGDMDADAKQAMDDAIAAYNANKSSETFHAAIDALQDAYVAIQKYGEIHDCEAEFDHWSIDPSTSSTFQKNTWSTEADPSGMKTPFIEYWKGSGNPLTDAVISHETITGTPGAIYSVSIDYRAFNENSTKVVSQGSTFNANSTSADLCVGTRDVYNNVSEEEYAIGYTVLCVADEETGAIDIHFDIVDADFDWFAFKNLVVKAFDPETDEWPTLTAAEGDMHTGYDNAQTTALQAYADSPSFTTYLAAFNAVNAAHLSALFYEDVHEVVDKLDETGLAKFDELTDGAWGDKTLEYQQDMTDIFTQAQLAQTTAGTDWTLVVKNTGEWTGNNGTYGAGAECYGGNGENFEPGKILYKNIEGLVAGATYAVTFDAAASAAQWEPGGVTYGSGIAQIFANDTAVDIDVIEQSSISDLDVYTHTLTCTIGDDGVLEFGLQNVGTGGNWYVVEEMGLTLVALADVDSDYHTGDEVTVDGTIYTVLDENEIYNHSFELGFTGWTKASDFTTTIDENFELRTDDPQNYYYYLVGTSTSSSSSTAGAAGTSSLGTAWPIEPATTYMFTYWIKQTDMSQKAELNYIITSLTNTPGTETVKFDEIESLGTDWQMEQIVFTNGEEDADDCYAYLQIDFRWLKGRYGFDNFSLHKVEATGVEWEMTEAEWGTLILPFAADVPSGLTAYSCAEVSGDELVLTEAATLEANTPYIMAGTAATYEFTGVAVDAENGLTAGLLTGTYETLDCEALLEAAGTGTVYLLQNHDGEVAFYQVIETESDGATLTPYHCYLTSAVSPTALRLPGAGDATAIEAVESEVIADGAIYDLSGRKVSKAVKGVYIQNGKKVLVK